MSSPTPETEAEGSEQGPLTPAPQSVFDTGSAKWWEGGEKVKIGESFSPRKLDTPLDRLTRKKSGRRSRSRTDRKRGRYIQARPAGGKTNDLAFDATLRAGERRFFPVPMSPATDVDLVVSLGDYVYEGWQSGVPLDKLRMMWTMTYKVVDPANGATVAEYTASAAWRCDGVDDIRREIAPYALEMTEHEDYVVVRRPVTRDGQAGERRSDAEAASSVGADEQLGCESEP